MTARTMHLTRNPLGFEGRTVTDGKLVTNPQFEWAGGGLATTPEDLARWAKALYEGGAFKKKATLEAMLTGVDSTGDGDKIPDDSQSQNLGCRLEYRYFWWLRDKRNDFTAIGRNGQFVHIYPDRDTVIVQISDWDTWSDPLQCETFLAHDALEAAAR